jgi:hypothetical protein
MLDMPASLVCMRVIRIILKFRIHRLFSLMVLNCNKISANKPHRLVASVKNLDVDCAAMAG